jgi:hypothetical protein
MEYIPLEYVEDSVTTTDLCKLTVTDTEGISHFIWI